MGSCESCGVSDVKTRGIKVGNWGLQVCAKCYAIIGAENARKAAAESKKNYYEEKKRRLG